MLNKDTNNRQSVDQKNCRHRNDLLNKEIFFMLFADEKDFPNVGISIARVNDAQIQPNLDLLPEQSFAKLVLGKYRMTSSKLMTID